MSRATQDSTGRMTASRTGLSPSAAGLSRPFRSPPSIPSVVLQPRTCRNRYGLGSSPFARHYLGNHCLFSLPAGNKMFQFPAFAHSMVCRASCPAGCPIRIPADQRLFAPPRGFSQLIASFFASESQGIRHAPFSTFLRHAPQRSTPFLARFFSTRSNMSKILFCGEYRNRTDDLLLAGQAL